MARGSFYLDEFISKQQKHERNQVVRREHATVSQLDNFYQLCAKVKEALTADFMSSHTGAGDATTELLLTQKRAIIGYNKEVNYFKAKIDDFLKRNNLSNEWYPSWFDDLVSAIFHENWGLTGVMEWKNNKKDSQSCKLIGERVYFLIDGRLELQTQRISEDRIKQLIAALMLRTPEKRLDEGNAEVYMLDGTRITIFLHGEDGVSKEPTIIFRRYTVENYTFAELADRGTIQKEAVPMFEAWARVGFNVGFIGPVRSGKTTALATWQCCEDEKLEGISVETDPEIPFHVLMPKSPIIQVVADGDKLKKIIKKLLRADGDYLIMAEARDGVAMKIALEATNRGTRRVKFTYHTSDAIDFPYDAANSIVQEFGGDIWANCIKIARNIHYLFEFSQLKDKSQKRLKAIYELRFNPKTLEVLICQICKYHPRQDTWTYKYDIGEDKRAIAEMEDYDAYLIFEHELKRLAEAHPMDGDHITELPYTKFMMKVGR